MRGGFEELPSAKSARVGEKKRTVNSPLRRRARTFVTKTRRLIASNEIDAADRSAHDAIVALDKAAQKGAIHPNNAARRKSRIMKRLNEAKSA